MDSTGQDHGEEREEHLQALDRYVVAVETTRMPIVFTDAHAGHRIIFANDSFLKLTGYPRKDVIGRPFARLVTGGDDPDVLAGIDDSFQSSVESLHVECRRRDGGYVSTSLCVAPVHDREGVVVQYFASLVDLTAQVKRRRSERNALHALYQRAPDFIAITEGPDHRFVFANPAYQRLVGDRDLIGRMMREALPEVAGQRFLTECDTVYRTGKAFVGKSMAVKLQRQTGAAVELRYLDFVYQAIEGIDGTINGIFCEGHDATEQKALEDRVQALQIDLNHLARLSAMGTMAAALAHELTQPMTAIANYTAACEHLNKREGDNREQMADMLASLATAVSRCTDVIQRLRAMTERRKSPRERFRLKDAIHESIALVRASIPTIASIIDRSSEHIELDADRTQIQQVLINLLRNGCEAVGDTGGRVTISTTVKQGKVIVSVRDTGEGVSPEAAKSLFHWADSSKPDGSGIGLSISRTIVEAHGGEMWLDESGHTGSCFAFSLPLWSHDS